MANNKKTLDTNSNTYTILYAVVIVIVVAFLLAFVSSALRSKQEVNVALDKKKQILAALNIRDINDSEVDERYKQIVLADNIIDEHNQMVKQGTQGGQQAGFTLNSSDYKAGRLALYICQVDGQRKYVIPVYGMGLWGPISGYISINDDRNTIYGAYFNHESETAGLGAEIKDSREWQQQFAGKQLTKAGVQGIALAVVKKSEVKDATVQCDAVTGATLTSDGVSLMLQECLGKYIEFLNETKQ